MPQNFLACDRDQELLLPPNLRDWLPDDHFAWFVLDAVAEMDLDAFYTAYRADGHGRAAHEPRMMVALLLYAYARGERSSRAIERALHEDIAYRVIAANAAPDHATIARFRQRHEAALADLFGAVLALCAKAGIAQPTVLCVDSTKLNANASRDATRSYEQLAKEILEEAGQVDAQEDAKFGARRGDELPPELVSGEGRRAWLREAKRQLDEQRAKEAKPVPRSRPARVKDAKRRLEEELFTEQRANESYEAWRAGNRMRDGRRLGRHSPPAPYAPPAVPTGKVNVSDPDSTLVKSRQGFIQGYSAQAVVNEHQVVVGAELHATGTDFGQLGPMVDKALDELRRAGVEERPDVVLADAGYWHTEQIGAQHWRHDRPDSARLLEPQGQAARLGQGPLRVHAQGARNRPRPRSLRQTQSDDRAGLRADEVQPPDGPLPASRQVRLPLGMAADRGNPQPLEAPPARNRARGGLRAAAQRGFRRVSSPDVISYRCSSSDHAGFTRQPLTATGTSTASQLRPTRACLAPRRPAR
jgi:transposase